MGNGPSVNQALQQSDDTACAEMLAKAMHEDPDRVDRIIQQARNTTEVAPVHPPSDDKKQSLPSGSSLSIEEQIVKELNLCRTDPLAYAEFAEDLLSHFIGKNYHVPDSSTVVVTTEGSDAVVECVNFLKTAPATGVLTLEDGISKSAQDHVVDLGKHGLMTHDGTDGSTVRSRVERYGDWKQTCGENIACGYDTAREIVLQLMIDDGVASRGHRLNIMNDQFHVVGLALGPHAALRHVCVMDFAGGYGPKAIRLEGPEQVTAQGASTAKVQAILNSIPFDHMKEEVIKCLENEPETKVTLNYTPSSIEISYARSDGSVVTQQGSWGVKDA